MRKRELLDNVKNIVWALVFGVALWFVMVQSQQKTDSVKARLHVQAGRGVIVKYGTPNEQAPEETITVRGSASDLQRMRREVDAHYVVPEDAEMKEHRIPWSKFKFDTDPGIEVDTAALEGELVFTLAKVTAGRLIVEADFDGQAPEGWEVEGKPVVDPQELDASGPVDEMTKGPPRLRTDPVSLQRMIQRFGFDPKSTESITYEQVVGVSPPEKLGIKVHDTRPVKLRVTIRPKPKERDIDLEPSFLFPGPTFEGVPFKLTPFGKSATVRVRVAGRELDLLDAVIRTTREKFVVYVRPKAEELEKGKMKVGDILTFDVVVIPPPGIKVLSEPDPKTLRFDVGPLDAAGGTGDK